MADEILTERRGRTLVITINSPEARNAFNLPVAQGLAAAMDELDDSPELSVAILTGAGGNFCAGMDLKSFVDGENVVVPGRGLGFTEAPPRKPIISAVEGYALAGGTELVLATDLVEVARAAVPELRSMEPFDVYRGEQVGERRKSIAFRVEFRSPERTLTDEEAAGLREKIVAALRERFGAELRA